MVPHFGKSLVVARVAVVLNVSSTFAKKQTKTFSKIFDRYTDPFHRPEEQPNVHLKSPRVSHIEQPSAVEDI